MLSFRKLAKKDDSALLSEIRKLWHIDAFFDDDILLNHVAGENLARSLLACNYTEVAVVDGKTAGFLLGRIESGGLGRLSALGQYSAHRRALDLAIGPAAEQLKEYQKLDEAFSSLRLECEKPFSGELVLFRVLDSFQGLGVGKALLQRFEKQLCKKKGNSYFLFTDSFCDVSFYDHNRFTLEAQTSFPVKTLTEAHLHSAFLYSKKVSYEAI